MPINRWGYLSKTGRQFMKYCMQSQALSDGLRTDVTYEYLTNFSAYVYMCVRLYIRANTFKKKKPLNLIQWANHRFITSISNTTTCHENLSLGNNILKLTEQRSLIICVGIFLNCKIDRPSYGHIYNVVSLLTIGTAR